jgi:hypothetical protein
MNALSGYVQLSDPNFHAQTANRDEAISLRRNEVIVDFIAYYHLPILFENVRNESDLGQYNFYQSSLIQNRLDNMVYKVLSGEPASENGVELQNIVLGNYNVSFYPHIRVIKWKNEYDPSFNFIGTGDVNDSLMTGLGWGNPMQSSTIVTKYLNTENGTDWIHKLVEMTYAYLKYGKPLRTLNPADIVDVESIYNLTTSSIDLDSNFEVEAQQTALTFKIKKEAFSGYL